MMREWRGRCHRCGNKSDMYTMSRFNTDLICMTCMDEERRHPRYNEAVDAEEKACHQGNYNFQGIGWFPIPKGGNG